MVISITKLSASSWFKIKTDDTILYIDPGYIGDFKAQEIPESELEEKADIIFITHFHMDHFQPEALDKIRKEETIIIAPQNGADKIEGNFKAVKPEEELNIKNIKINVVNAYNTPEGHSTKKFHHKGEWVGYLITLNGKTIYHAGDTDFIPEMKEFRNINVALLPIGGTFTMDIPEAVEAVLTIKPEVIIPMHMKDVDPEEFKKIVEEKSDIKVILLKIGEKYEL